MSKIRKITSERLKELLKDKDIVMDDLSFHFKDMDDNQLHTINNFKKLDPLYQNIIYLRSFMKLQDIADVYGVSVASVHKMIKKIQSFL